MANERDLTTAISQSINSKSSGDKGRKVAYRLDDKESPSEIKHWVPSGSTVLDTIISNKREGGGFPVGKIVEIYGESGSGKSLIASHAMANCQQMGGAAVYIDTEHAADFDFLRTIGIDPQGDFLYVAENRLEDIFQMVETVIEKTKENDEDKPVVVVVDSLAGAVPKNEIEGNYEKEGYNTDKAIVLSQAMRKITGITSREDVLLLFTNQVRVDPEVMYGDPHVTPGGKAVDFHASVQVHMRESKPITDGGEVVGTKIRPKVVKNRLAPPERTCAFDLYFTTGINDYSSWWQPLKDAGYMDHVSSGWYKVRKDPDEDEYYMKSDIYEDGDDEPLKVQKGNGFANKLNQDPELKDEMERLLKDTLVHDYEEGWVDRSDVEYGEDSED